MSGSLLCLAGWSEFGRILRAWKTRDLGWEKGGAVGLGAWFMGHGMVDGSAANDLRQKNKKEERK